MSDETTKSKPGTEAHFQAPAVLEVYHRLFKHFGPQHWWPAETPFEVIIGAVLTQNTAWTNVEKAIHQLRLAGLLNLETLRDVPEEKLAQLIHSSGFFNLKARRLKVLTDFIFKEYGGSLEHMFSEPGLHLRKKLLSLKGLGPETVDSILLYAGGMPFFVIDAYTRRIFSRHQWFDPKTRYETLQHYFMSQQPLHTKIFNEYHALIVKTAKIYCKKQPECSGCPLRTFPVFL